MSLINFDGIRKAPLNETPFPFAIVPDFLQQQELESLAKDFPSIEFPGSIPLEQVQYGSQFGVLIQELQGDRLRSVIEEKLSVNLQGRPVLITVRGKTRKRDGQIHTDTKSKLVTLLLYFNPAWEADGGRLRILKDGKHLDDYVAEVPPSIGTALIFKVTDNCWHGHKPFVGVRKTLQLNYVTDESALHSHLSRHNFSGKLKSFKHWIKGNY